VSNPFFHCAPHIREFAYVQALGSGFYAGAQGLGGAKGKGDKILHGTTNEIMAWWPYRGFPFQGISGKDSRMSSTDGKEFVEGLARGIRVIQAFDAEAPELTLSDVARRTGLSPATVRRSLHTLMQLGYVRCVNRRFLLTAKILTIGSAYLRSTHIEDALLPELRRLVKIFGDAASVAVLNGNDILYVAHHSEQRGARPVAGTGVTYPAYATSLGRVLLSGLPDEAIIRYLYNTPLHPLTDVTVTNPAELFDIIRQIRGVGYAVAVDQLAYGVSSIAVPIMVDPGRLIAAVNSSGYTGRLSPEILIDTRLSELRKTAAQLTETLLRYPALRHSLERGGHNVETTEGPRVTA